MNMELKNRESLLKRLAQFTVAGIAAVILAGCSGSSDSGTETTTTTTTAENPIEKYVGRYSVVSSPTPEGRLTGKLYVLSTGVTTAKIVELKDFLGTIDANGRVSMVNDDGVKVTGTITGSNLKIIDDGVILLPEGARFTFTASKDPV
ncbi:MAG: hypothetical protein VW771_08810 [Gammaproteobacteria bacterium]